LAARLKCPPSTIDVKIFLRIKNWQLFLAVIIPLTVALELALTLGIKDISPIWIIILLSISAEVLIAWYYSLGTNLYKRSPGLVELNLDFIRICIPITALSMPLFFYFTLYQNNFEILLTLLGFINAASLLYLVYSIAKGLTAIELHREVTTNDFQTEFLLLCFYPIGILAIQPRINKLFMTVD
jgi:hypothetical protein